MHAHALFALTESLRAAQSLVFVRDDATRDVNEAVILSTIADSASEKSRDAIFVLEKALVRLDDHIAEGSSTLSSSDDAHFTALFSEHSRTLQLLEALYDHTCGWTYAPSNVEELTLMLQGALTSAVSSTNIASLDIALAESAIVESIAASFTSRVASSRKKTRLCAARRLSVSANSACACI